MLVLDSGYSNGVTQLYRELSDGSIAAGATREQVEMAKKQFSSNTSKYPIIKSWCDLPGVGMIRATTIFAYLDTPWRFKNRAKLHRYCAVRIVRMAASTRFWDSPDLVCWYPSD